MSAVGKTGAPSISTSATTLSKKRAGVGRLADGQLSHDGKYRWSAGWEKWIPVPDPLPAGRGPMEGVDTENQILGVAAQRPIRHGSSCLCGPCSVAGQRYSDYAKAKAVRNRGF